MATKGPEKLALDRKKTLEYYAGRATELEAEEKELHSMLPEDVNKVVKDKRILLFKEMLRDISYDDMDVVNIIKLGIRIVGLLKGTGIWEKSDEKMPRMEVRHLWASSQTAQAKVRDQSRSRGDDGLAKAVWDLTLEEAKNETIIGPLTEEEITSQVGKCWVPARRFGLKQGSKIRPIDDFSEHGINKAFGATEKLALLSVDHVVAWSRALMEAARDDGSFKVVDSNNQVWAGQLHSAWTVSKWRSLVGRVADLKNAYKQIASSPTDGCFNIIAVWDPKAGKTKFFRAVAMMFGQTAAVYAFIRVSRALSALGARLFSLLLVEFFDDFTQVESSETGESAKNTLEGMLNLLGWEVATTEAKCKPAEVKFNSLGVEIDYAESVDRKVTIRPKEGRIKKILEEVMEILSEGQMDFKQALSVKGKLQFAEGQLYHRVTAVVCRLLSRWAATGGRRPLTPEMREALTQVQPALLMAGPRAIVSLKDERPVVILIDGACEEEGTSIGAVMIRAGARPQAFGATLTREAIESLKTRVEQKQVIGQAEILPAMVAKEVWGSFLVNKRAIYFIDNDSARLALIKGYSPVLASLKLIMQCAAMDSRLGSTSWYARVHTNSNIADEPSRMRRQMLDEMGALVVQPNIVDAKWWFSDVMR